MKEIRDCKGRLACKGDAATGLIESMYRGQKTQTILAVGAYLIIERDGVVTVITRISLTAFKVESHAGAA
jgi:hypothetical protein